MGELGTVKGIIIGVIAAFGIILSIGIAYSISLSNSEASIGGQTITPISQKIINATVSIDRVQTQAANLFPTRVTVANVGDIAFSPKFDMIVFDSDGNEVCNASPLFSRFTQILPGQKQTEELSIMCILERDDMYTLRVNVFDVNFDKLAVADSEFIVRYWDSFS